MFRIFLAEDNDSDAYHLEQCLQTWAQSTNVALSIQRSQNLTEKLAAAVQHYDALFLDIKMHGLDGLTFAKLVREKIRKFRSFLCLLMRRSMRWKDTPSARCSFL